MSEIGLNTLDFRKVHLTPLSLITRYPLSLPTLVLGASSFQLELKNVFDVKMKIIIDL